MKTILYDKKWTPFKIAGDALTLALPLLAKLAFCTYAVTEKKVRYRLPNQKLTRARRLAVAGMTTREDVGTVVVLIFILLQPQPESKFLRRDRIPVSLELRTKHGCLKKKRYRKVTFELRPRT